MKETREILLDRTVEIAKLSTIINNNKQNNLIVLVTGISGVGKSGLIRKLDSSGVLSSVIVNVKMSKISVSTIENLQYFNALYKTLQDYAIKNNALLPTPTQHGYRSIGNLIRYIFYLIKSKRGYGDAISISEPADDISIIRKKDYINYVLKNSNIVLDIENIQNIDTQSFELLREIIDSSNNNTFILEYTVDENSDNHFSNFYKELLETDATIITYEVEHMDFYYASQLAPKTKAIDKETLRKRYEISNGNLMEIILSNEHSNLTKSNIYTSVQYLSDSEKYIIFLIYLHDNSIDYNTIHRFFVFQISNNLTVPQVISDKNGIIKTIEQLKEKQLLEEKDYRLYIKHDTIVGEIDVIEKDPILFVAYANIKEFYLNENYKNRYSIEHIEKLLSLFIKFSDPELLTILPEVKQIISDLKYPNLIINELENFRNRVLGTSSLNQRSVYPLTIMIVEICLANKLLELAQENLDIIYDQTNPYHIALQGEIYALQENENAGTQIAELMLITGTNTRLNLILELCELYHSMKINRTNESKNIGKRILRNKKYKQFKEYGFVLRNYAELCESDKECINYYNQAISIFKKFNMEFEIACVYISLSMIYSYSGKYTIARNYIEKAIKIGKKSISQCYILNNIAAIDILSGKYDEKTEKRLLDAALLSPSQYEKIIIYCNLIIYYSITNNLSNAKKYVQRVENSSYLCFKYEEFLHIVFQDMFFFYNKNGNREKSQYYKEEIINLINDPITRKTTKKLAKEMIGLQKSTSPFIQKGFRVDFLGYWEFSFDNDLDHY